MDYYAIELHSHTNHSDGGFTTEERLQMQIEQNGLIHHLGEELQVGDAQLQVRMESILQEKLRNFGQPKINHQSLFGG